MRGTIEYQTGILAKLIYHPGMRKMEQKQSGFLANDETIQTYREIWNQLGHFIKDQFQIKDLQNTNEEHIQTFMTQLITKKVSEQYLELVSASLGKLQFALETLHEQFCQQNLQYAKAYQKTYNFNIRQTILNHARKNRLVIETSDMPDFSRAYENPKALIQAIDNPVYKLAAKIQYESGARLEGVERIDESMNIQTRKLIENHLIDIVDSSTIDDITSKVAQLQGYEYDSLECCEKGKIFDAEKGGKPGLLYVSPETYKELHNYLLHHNVFQIDRNQYRMALQKVAKLTHQAYQGTHGLRWNYAQERVYKIQIIGGLSYYQALQDISWTMKHERADISEHYLG